MKTSTEKDWDRFSFSTSAGPVLETQILANIALSLSAWDSLPPRNRLNAEPRHKPKLVANPTQVATEPNPHLLSSTSRQAKLAQFSCVCASIHRQVESALRTSPRRDAAAFFVLVVVTATVLALACVVPWLSGLK